MRIRVGRGLEAGRNRCQFLMTAPITLAVGSFYGVALAEAWDLDPFLGIFLGGLALTLFVYVQLLLEPIVVERLSGDSGRFDELVALVWDAITGTVVGLPLFRYLGVRPLPALVAAAGAGSLYGYIMGWMVCGGAASAFMSVATGSLSGKRRGADMSQIQALEARGEYDAARLEYEAVLAQQPSNITAATRLGRLLADHLERPADGVEVIRVAVGRGGAPPERWAYALRILTEICTVQLGDDRLAVPDLERLARRHPDEPGGEWSARRAYWIRQGD